MAHRAADDREPDRRALRATTEPVKGRAGRARSYLVRECLRVVLNEEWEHRLYAERDLDALEQRSA